MITQISTDYKNKSASYRNRLPKSARIKNEIYYGDVSAYPPAGIYFIKHSLENDFRSRLNFYFCTNQNIFLIC